jgi:hypothetical protein
MCAAFAYLSKLVVARPARLTWGRIFHRPPMQHARTDRRTVGAIRVCTLRCATCSSKRRSKCTAIPRCCRSAGQFPTPSVHDFYRPATEAARFYKSGKSFAYRYLPFWVASLLNRTLFVLLPIIVVVIPGLRFLPQLYNWRVNGRIHRRYGELMALERDDSGGTCRRNGGRHFSIGSTRSKNPSSPSKVPGSHAEALYGLRREHIGFVRAKPVPSGGIGRRGVG